MWLSRSKSIVGAAACCIKMMKNAILYRALPVADISLCGVVNKRHVHGHGGVMPRAI